MDPLVSTILNPEQLAKLLVLLPLFGTLVGSLFTYIIGRSLERRRARRDSTQKLIDEFYSEDFLRHRIALGLLRDEGRGNGDWYYDLAGGYFYPGHSEAKRGAANPESGLDGHQHLEFFLGYIRRLGHAIDTHQVNEEAILRALGSSFIWHCEVLDRLAHEIVARVGQNKDVAVMPRVVHDIDVVLNLLGRDPDIRKALNRIKATGSDAALGTAVYRPPSTAGLPTPPAAPPATP